MTRLLLQLSVICTFLVLGVYSLNNGVALTPQMGWNSWNHWGCSINETIMIQTAQAMKAAGMLDAGYTYVNVDDCWASSRAPNGTIQADPTTFPHGIAWLADQIHSLGFKFGIYTCAGNETCAGRPGSRGYECIDAATYASWGVDYVKEDWCNTQGLQPQSAYGTMRDCLNATGRPILFSLCDWGVDSPWEWGNVTGNSWRTTGDIQDNWFSMLSNFDQQNGLAPYAGVGGWNDPDMLEVGNGGMTNTEYQSHFSLWSILAAPLIAGNNPMQMDNDTLAILTAPEVIAVNQDPLGLEGVTISWDKPLGRQVLARPLKTSVATSASYNKQRKMYNIKVQQELEKPTTSSSSSSSLSSPSFSEDNLAAVNHIYMNTESQYWSVILFNRATIKQSVKLNFGDINSIYANSTATVRDLWARDDLGSFTSSFVAHLSAHAVSMLQLDFGN